MIAITDTHVSFRWKDRANGNQQKTETITGIEFVRRYLRHVLPRGMRAIRYFGFRHHLSVLRQADGKPPALPSILALVARTRPGGAMPITRDIGDFDCMRGAATRFACAKCPPLMTW
jgi:hypothetical protein